MKQLKLKNQSYLHIIELYAEWLQTLGYATKTVYSLPIFLREFFYYLERKGIYTLEEFTIQHTNDYYTYIQQRKNTRYDGALSNATINNHRRMLRSFCDYLRQSGRMILPALTINCLDDTKEKLNTLTESEIKLLFKATYSIDDIQQIGRPLLGERDRAMLSVLYGCALRRTEAVSLDINDIDSEKQIIHVRKGKNYKERLVPINKIYLQYIEDYIYNSRYTLLYGTSNSYNPPPSGETEGALFISQQHKRITDQSINLRLKLLIRHTGNQVLINKNPSLHTLRHSIATHLLHKGVQLEHIAKFLGHSSLESTQVYTHLAEQQQ